MNEASAISSGAARMGLGGLPQRLVQDGLLDEGAEGFTIFEYPYLTDEDLAGLAGL